MYLPPLPLMSRLGGAAACLFALTVAGPALGITTNLPDNVIVNQMLEREAEAYTAVVRQYGFNTTLNIQSTSVDGNQVLTSMNVVIGDTFENFSTATFIGGADNRYMLTSANSVISSGWFQYEIGGEIYRAEQWWIPTNYDEGEYDAFGDDIAIVRLDRAVDNVQAMNYATADDTVNLNGSGKQFTMVGVGTRNFSDNGDGDPLIGGVRRAARNTFDIDDHVSPGLLNSDLGLIYDFDQPLGAGGPIESTDDLPLGWREGMFSAGDEGGALIHNDKVVGVFSRSHSVGGKLHGVATDVGRFHSWINAIAELENASLGIGSSHWGYETGLAGITIQDIRDDLALTDSVLVEWLVGNGLLNFTTMMGTTPFFRMFDYDTGLHPQDLANLSVTPLSDEELQLAAEALADETFLANFGTENIDQMFTDLYVAYFNQMWADPSLAQDAPVDAFGNTISAADLLAMSGFFNTDLLGPNGHFRGGFIEDTPAPEPTTAAMFVVVAGGLLMRRRRAA